jgi:hypothetical protein
MEVFDINHALVGTGQVFPDHIEQADWIGYHSTSSFYSAQIESNGFSQMKPLPAADIDLVIELARRLGLDGDGVAGFKELKSISFSPVSELALDYSRPQSLGGQGVGYVRHAVDEILSKHGEQLDASEALQLAGIRDMIEVIRSGPPVVYAVDLKGLTTVRYQRITTGLYVYEPIPAARIKAKLNVSSPVDYSLINARKHRDGLRALASSITPHFTKLMPQE